ncbi:MAG TPA: hypothetical protein VNS19_03435 [Acidimicrobiales bacterium]|nr:hypothetical protein [Acidimicrobiales bacterium]
MLRRLALAAAAASLTLGLVAPTPAPAAVDPDYGWDYQALSINGSYQMLRGQFAGDAATDILFYGPGSAPDSLWIGKTGAKGNSGFTKVGVSIGGTYVPVVGDFAGDDYDDILFYGKGSAPDALWTSVPTSSYFSSKSVKISGTNYQPKVLMDYRDVGTKDDVLFLGPGTVPDYLWHFTESVGTPEYDGPGTWQSRTLKVNGSYQLVVGDFSGDYLDDVVLYQPGAARDYKWVSSTSGAFTQTNLTINGTYQPVTVRHQNFDGIYFWASGRVNEVYWTSNGNSFTSRPTGQYPTLTGKAESYGGNGVLIKSDNERDAFVYADGAGADSYYLANPNHDFGTAWQAATGDFNDDDVFDTFWYGPGTRKDEVWYGVPSSSDRSADPAPTVAKVTPITER